MDRITVPAGSRNFQRNGKPLFLLADTLWTAFSNITDAEWTEYLDFRAAQGFNAFQANILTQWDGGKPDSGLYPFAMNPDGTYDFHSINEAYFERVRAMLSQAVQRGITPVLVLLWLSYVKGTWLTKKDESGTMPLEHVKPYVEFAAKAFQEFHPVYLLSGDTDFNAESEAYYLAALETLRAADPSAAVSAHIAGGISQLPESLGGKLDFVMYQSCHFPDKLHWAYELAEALYRHYPQQPVMNGEPCYEAHAFGGRYGRYSRFDVRKAVWQSLLSGAGAGVSYGAQGVWSWHRPGKSFSNESFGGKPMEWRKALELKGAWDASFAKWVFENYALWDMLPRQEAVLNDTAEIRLSVSRDLKKVAAYIPYNDEIRLAVDLDGYDVLLIQLEERLFTTPSIIHQDGVSVIPMHSMNSDALLIAVKP